MAGGLFRNGLREIGRFVLKKSQALVAHTCNPSYSRGREQEDPGFRPAQVTKVRPYVENNPPPKGLVDWFKW
jgi:hypothetical protein